MNCFLIQRRFPIRLAQLELNIRAQVSRNLFKKDEKAAKEVYIGIIDIKFRDLSG